jgi:hypothetical protein
MSRREYSIRRFTGSDGKRRVNCAQAIAAAYHEDIDPLDEDTLQMFKRFGHGKAPGKSCGAYYAAEFLLTGHRSELIGSLKEHFTKEAESLNCRIIRRGKHLSCEGCVDNIARFLSLKFPAVGDDEKAVQARFNRRNL